MSANLSRSPSSGGLGAVLLQPIAYASKALTQSQMNYAQTEEMLATVLGCIQFRDYICGLKNIKVEKH